jgi:hypothetical protein
MSCGIDQACIAKDITAAMARLSDGPGFAGLEHGIATKRHAKSDGVLDHADVNFLIDNCPNIGSFIHNMVVNGFIDRLDTNKDGVINKAEFDAGSANNLKAPRASGVRLRSAR